MNNNNNDGRQAERDRAFKRLNTYITISDEEDEPTNKKDKNKNYEENEKLRLENFQLKEQNAQLKMEFQLTVSKLFFITSEHHEKTSKLVEAEDEIARLRILNAIEHNTNQLDHSLAERKKRQNDVKVGVLRKKLNLCLHKYNSEIGQYKSDLANNKKAYAEFKDQSKQERSKSSKELREVKLGLAAEQNRTERLRTSKNQLNALNSQLEREKGELIQQNLDLENEKKLVEKKNEELAEELTFRNDEIDSLKNRSEHLSKLVEDKAKLMNDLKDFESQKIQMEEEISQIKASIDIKNQKKLNELLSFQNMVDQFEAQTAKLIELKKELVDKVNALNLENTQLKANQSSNSASQILILDLKSMVKDLNTQLKNTKTDLAAIEKEKGIFFQMYDEASKKNSNLKAKHNALVTRLDTHEKTFDELQDACLNREQLLVEFEEENNHLRASLNEFLQKVETLHEELKSTKTEFTDIIKRKNKKISGLNQKINKVEKTKECLEINNNLLLEKIQHYQNMNGSIGVNTPQSQPSPPPYSPIRQSCGTSTDQPSLNSLT